MKRVVRLDDALVAWASIVCGTTFWTTATWWVLGSGIRCWIGSFILSGLHALWVIRRVHGRSFLI